MSRYAQLECGRNQLRITLGTDFLPDNLRYVLESVRVEAATSVIRLPRYAIHNPDTEASDSGDVSIGKQAPFGQRASLLDEDMPTGIITFAVNIDGVEDCG